MREGEAWDARDLDELLVNMWRYDQWKSIGAAATILLTGGIDMVAFVVATRGSIISSVYAWPALGLFLGATTLGVSVGYITSDRRFAARADAPPAPRAQVAGIFSGPDGAWRRPRWVLVLDVSLIVGVITCTVFYALGTGGRLEDEATRLAIARHPWLIWCVPVALCVIVAVQELLVWWEMRRPPLGLTQQPELAGRADLHWRRAAYRTVHDSEMVPMLAVVQLMAFSSSALTSIAFALLIVAIGAYVVEGIASFLAESRRTRQGRNTADAGLRGGGRVV